MTRIARWAAIAALALAAPAAAQSVSPFGSFKHDQTQPIEIAADSLEVREEQKIAIFRGEVVAGQGSMRLTADELEVNYADAGGGSGEIQRLQARGSVFLANGAETAKGEYADYDVAAGTIAMTGDVVLTQGGNVVRGASLRIDLNTGQGKVEGGGGRVQSVFAPRKRDAD